MFPVEIAGRRTVLRELTEKDAPALTALISHPEVARRVIDDQIPDETAMRELIRYSLATATDRHRWQYRLGVTVDVDLIVSGTLTVVSREHRRGEIGYSIHPDRQGGGLATDAARSLLRLGFGLLGLTAPHRGHDPPGPHRLPAGATSRRGRTWPLAT